MNICACPMDEQKLLPLNPSVLFFHIYLFALYIVSYVRFGMFLFFLLFTSLPMSVHVKVLHNISVFHAVRFDLNHIACNKIVIIVMNSGYCFIYLFLSPRIYAINFDDDDDWGWCYCCCICVWCAMFVVYCYIHVELTSSVLLAWWVGRTNKLITIWHHFYWTRFNLDLILSIHRATSNDLYAQCYVNMFRIPTNRYYLQFHCDWMSCTRVLQVIPICWNINATQKPYQVIIESDREIHIKKTNINNPNKRTEHSSKWIIECQIGILRGAYGPLLSRGEHKMKRKKKKKDNISDGSSSLSIVISSHCGA